MELATICPNINHFLPRDDEEELRGMTRIFSWLRKVVAFIYSLARCHPHHSIFCPRNKLFGREGFAIARREKETEKKRDGDIKGHSKSAVRRMSIPSTLCHGWGGQLQTLRHSLLGISGERSPTLVDFPLSHLRSFPHEWHGIMIEMTVITATRSVMTRVTETMIKLKEIVVLVSVPDQWW